MGLIYLVKNIVNGKRYVGQTKRTLKKRMNEHLSSASAGEKTYLYNAIRKYGGENFIIELLETSDDLDEAEKFHIKQINPEYNLTEGGGGVVFRYKRKAIHNYIEQRYIHIDADVPKGFTRGILPSTRAKMIAGVTGKIRSDEAKLSTAEKHRGMKRSDDAKLKMSKSAKERGISSETRLKMAASRKGIPRSEETKAKMRATNAAKRLLVSK